MARHTWRHFKALMRKNLINWKRQPVCAFFEIISPCILMAIIAIVRWKVPYVKVDSQGMLDQKLASFPGAGKSGGVWSHSTGGNDFTEFRENTFFTYANYTTHGKPPLPFMDSP